MTGYAAHECAGNAKAGVERANRMFANGTPNPPCSGKDVISRKKLVTPFMFKYATEGKAMKLSFLSEHETIPLYLSNVLFQICNSRSEEPC